MPAISIRGLGKMFGEDVAALENVDLEIAEGEFLVILGPSGCGKTTTLRSVAGLEEPDSGSIFIGDHCVFSADEGVDVPPRERNIGMIFQNYALYPHMTVFQNVAFGLKVRKFDRAEIERRVTEALKVVDLTGFETRRPRQLSGGQQQRVAVARTIASNPQVLLFDEPLSNLDPELRVSVRNHLKKIHGRLGATSLFVTHDQHEAMVLADRIAVMDHGRIAQIDRPDRLYRFPETSFVAEFTGNPKTNLIRGEVHISEGRPLLVPDADPYCFVPLDEDFKELRGNRVVVHVRPEDLEVVRDPGEDEGRLSILAVMQDGPDAYVHLRFGEGINQLISRAEPREITAFQRGERVGLRFRRGNIFDPETGTLAGSFGYGRELAGRRR